MLNKFQRKKPQQLKLSPAVSTATETYAVVALLVAVSLLSLTFFSYGLYHNFGVLMSAVSVKDYKLTASWNFNAGAAVADSSVNRLNGALAGNAKFVSSTYGRVADLDGLTGYVSFGRPESLLSITDQITISAWIYQRNRGHANDIYQVIYSDAKDNADQGTTLAINTNGSVRWFFNKNNYRYAAHLGNLVLNKWTHVVAVFDGSTLSVYLDGRLFSVRPTPAQVAMKKNEAQIGKLGGLNATVFDGLIDDVKIFNSALTATDIGQLNYCSADPLDLRCQTFCGNNNPLSANKSACIKLLCEDAYGFETDFAKTCADAKRNNFSVSESYGKLYRYCVLGDPSSADCLLAASFDPPQTAGLIAGFCENKYGRGLPAIVCRNKAFSQHYNLINNIANCAGAVDGGGNINQNRLIQCQYYLNASTPEVVYSDRSPVIADKISQISKLFGYARIESAIAQADYRLSPGMAGFSSDPANADKFSEIINALTKLMGVVGGPSFKQSGESLGSAGSVAIVGKFPSNVGWICGYGLRGQDCADAFSAQEPDKRLLSSQSQAYYEVCKGYEPFVSGCYNLTNDFAGDRLCKAVEGACQTANNPQTNSPLRICSAADYLKNQQTGQITIRSDSSCCDASKHKACQICFRGSPLCTAGNSFCSLNLGNVSNNIGSNTISGTESFLSAFADLLRCLDEDSRDGCSYLPDNCFISSAQRNDGDEGSPHQQGLAVDITCCGTVENTSNQCNTPGVESLIGRIQSCGHKAIAAGVKTSAMTIIRECTGSEKACNGSREASNKKCAVIHIDTQTKAIRPNPPYLSRDCTWPPEY